MATSVVITGKLPKKPTIIEAFPSKGFVSTIVANHMVYELGMDLVGYVDSDDVPSITLIHDSKPMRPVRIYAKRDIVLILSELIVPLDVIKRFSKSLNDWFVKAGPKQVILLAGISGADSKDEHEILGIANNEELSGKLRKFKVRLIEDGMLTGISSELLLFCIENKIPTISLMSETSYIPDPLAAASILKIMNGILGLNIDTKNLVKTGKLIEERFKELSEQMKRGREDYQKIESFSPMYG